MHFICMVCYESEIYQKMAHLFYKKRGIWVNFADIKPKSSALENPAVG